MKKSETRLNRKIIKYLLFKHILQSKKYQWDLFYDIFIQEGRLREFRKLELQPFLRVDRIVDINIYRLMNNDSITYLVVFPEWNEKNKKDLIYYFMRTLGEFYESLTKNLMRELKRIDVLILYPETLSEKMDEKTRLNIEMMKESVLTEYHKSVELSFSELELPCGRNSILNLGLMFDMIDERFSYKEVTQNGIRDLFNDCIRFNVFREFFIDDSRYKLLDEIMAYLSFSSELEFLN